MIHSILLVPVLFLGTEIDSIRMVPEDTFLFLECDDVRGTLDHFEESSLGKAFLDGKDLKAELAPLYKDIAEELGIKQGDVTLPNHAAVALFVTFNEDLGIEVPGYLALLTWDDDETLPRALFEQRVRDLSIDALKSFEREELRGREMIVIEEAFELPDFDAAADEMNLPLGDWGHFSESLSTQYMIRDGGRLMLSSDPVALDDALRVIDGIKNKSLADNTDYQALEEMLPAGGNPDMKVMIITGPMAPLTDQLFAGPAAAAMPIMQELIGSLGGFGLWMSFATEGNVMEAGFNVLIDGEPRGILKLVDISRPGGDIPSYVPAEAVSYTRVNFDFKNLIPTIKRAVAALPEGEAAQIEPMLDQMAPMMQAGLETLGPEIHIFTTPTHSEFEPTRQTVAIPTSNGEAITQTLAMFAPMMGLVPRDFNGNTIYSDPLDEFNRMAIGVGAGSLLIGDIDGVEAVLRTAGQGDLPQLGRTNVARRVERSLPGGDLMLWGVVDLFKQAEAVQGMLAMMPMLLANADVDPGELQDMMEAGLGEIDAKRIQELFGPLWYYGKSTENGFQIRAGVMDPDN